MNCPLESFPTIRSNRYILGCLVFLSCFSCVTFVGAAGHADDGDDASPKPGGEYQAATDLLPDTTAGLVRVPNLPRFCEAFERTQVGKLLDEPSMQPFIEAQRDRARNYLDSVGKIGLKLEDLYDIGTGEVVFAWLPFEKDKRHPFSLCVVADVRGSKEKAEATLEQIDKDLRAGGATRKDVEHRGQTVRVYAPQRKPGQLKVEQIAITLNDVRIIAADRDSVVTDLLDAIAGEPRGESISQSADFKTVLTRSGTAIRKPLTDGGGAVAAEWFARPFQMGRIVREALNVDRGNDIDILKLLENQGFDALKAAGGVALIDGKQFDFLHRGFVLAPPTTDQPSKYEKAARMLQFVNTPRKPIPAWIDKNAATFNRVHMRIEEAFWSLESLVDEAMNDEIFRETIRGIANDQAGPRLDLEKEFLPFLDDQILLMTDNTMPVDVHSERLLVAIRLNDAEAIRKALRKVMSVEPDATKLEVVPGVEIWRIEPSQTEETFDPEIFGDLELGLEDETEEPPLVEQGAIGVVDKENDAYLMFASHPELLIETARRIRAGDAGGYQGEPEVTEVVNALNKLGCQTPAYDRISRTRLALRAKYELLRMGKLRESDSMLATFIRRLSDEDEGGEPDPLNATKLPPFAAIEKFFPNGGRFTETVADGWELTSFLLK